MFQSQIYYFQLLLMERHIQFPDPNLAEDEGLVASGGELSVEFLISAYSQGLFPWFNEGDPILWWSPNPRMVLFPSDFKCSASFKQTLHSNKFSLRIDENFELVIKNCSLKKRNGQEGTWITNDMIAAYTRLHQAGYAHSFETWRDNILVGGLYGVSLGKAFYGESMFYIETDASKFALYWLCEMLKNWEFHFIDVQQSTSHLKSLGAVEIERKEFLRMNSKAMKPPTRKGKWSCF
jgi:leucyl/phenylalanyl-tRNA---protein transferase